MYHAIVHSSNTVALDRSLFSKGCRYLLVALCLFFITPVSLWANTIIVNTKKDGFADDGLCTLAEAIVTANNNSAVDATSCAVGSGIDTIEFVVSQGSILLTDALPTVSESLIIKGPGPDELTLNGVDTHRVFHIDSGGNAQSVDISGLTITRGMLFATSGAAVSVFGDTLNLSDCVISNNTALAGGAIFNSGGTVTINTCTVSGNTASAVQGGGNGGGINNAGTMTIDSSTISNNSASHWGAGIFNGGTMTVRNSTINGNDTPTFGGGIYHTGVTLNVSNSTISGNTANESGGGIFTESELFLIHDTITSNIADNDDNFSGTGGGITIDGTGFTVFIDNSIIAGNQSGASGLGANQDCSGTLSVLGAFLSGGNNLFDDVAGCTGLDASDLENTDPLLGTLADRGGPSKTHALQSGSPALEAIAPSACTSVTEDQRTVPRPQDGDNDGSANCDIGAYEKADPDNVDLTLVMDDGINAITVGNDITWTETIRNRGPAVANNVVLTNVLPAETSFVSATPAACALQADNVTVICNLGTLAVNATTAVTITATTNSIATILNNATVSSSETEIIAGDNTASEKTFVQAANTAPVAVDDSFVTVTNTVLTTTNVIDNDEDADGDLLFISTADTVSVNGGSVVDNGDGTFDYTSATDFIGTDSFNYTITDNRGGTSTAKVTITVTAPPKKPGAIDFSSAAFTGKEGSGATANIKLTRTGGNDGVVGVTVEAADGSAIVGEDYTTTSKTITWQDGETADKTITIELIDDALAENDETVLLALVNPTGGATLGSQDSAVLTISDDDTSSNRNIIISGTEKQRSGNGALDVFLLLMSLLIYLSRSRGSVA